MLWGLLKRSTKHGVNIMALVLNGIHKKFGDLYVLKNLSMSLEDHKLICILGPSGCGKTTLLNIISAVYLPDQGTISGIDGKVISYLFQETRLLPWKTAAQNVEFVLKECLTPTQCHAIADYYLDLVGLKDFKNYYPDKLSGGMKQRVAIARAFAYPADWLLMDEPFKGLDVQLKATLMEAFLNLWQLDRRSTIFVTHDIDEAVLLGEEIYVLTERPTAVKGLIHNNVPHEQRKLSEMSAIEEEIYDLLTTVKWD
jgi:NitT/TauT family transport system ATP-binding protein